MRTAKGRAQLPSYRDLEKLEPLDGREARVLSTDFLYRADHGRWVCIGRVEGKNPSR